MTDISLDLDILTPPVIQVKFNDQVIKVNPPTLTEYVKIIDFSQRFQALNSADGKLDPEKFKETATIYQEIEAFIKGIIPEFAETELNFSQVTALYKLLSEIGAPTDKVIDKLKEQGIDLKAETVN